MPFTSSNPYWILATMVAGFPIAIALFFGGVLCFRHAYGKPHTTKCVATAILLLVASAAPEVILPVARWVGFRLTRHETVPLVIVIMQSALQAAGLALLFWTAFCDETPLEFDDGPPVYRNDDGSGADG